MTQEKISEWCQHIAVKRKKLCCPAGSSNGFSLWNWTRQNKSTAINFHEACWPLGHHRWSLKDEMFVKKKRITPWIVLSYTHLRSLTCSWLHTYATAELEKHSVNWEQAWLQPDSNDWLIQTSFAASTLRWSAIACEVKGDVWLNSSYLFTQSIELLLLLQPSSTSCKRIVPPPCFADVWPMCVV